MNPSLSLPGNFYFQEEEAKLYLQSLGGFAKDMGHLDVVEVVGWIRCDAHVVLAGEQGRERFGVGCIQNLFIIRGTS